MSNMITVAFPPIGQKLSQKISEYIITQTLVGNYVPIIAFAAIIIALIVIVVILAKKSKTEKEADINTSETK